MGFNPEQQAALEAKLKVGHVKDRQKNGVVLSYIEGWHAIAEANRIFGFDGWSRETIETACVWDGSRQNRRACSYTARVRIRVMAGGREIVREGCGSGHGFADTAGEAHEKALKEAETDATKRALSTFGNPFGLALYDKERRGVTRPSTSRPNPSRPLWELRDQAGQLHSQHTDPVDYCANFRRLLENAADLGQLQALWERNQNTLLILKARCRDLKSDKGQHYTDILAALFAARQKAFEAPSSDDSDSEPQSVAGEDASAPQPAPENEAGESPPAQDEVRGWLEKRIRNRDHLQYVASQPCLICGRNNAQAHHLTVAQAKALGKKAGDQWTVPLCAIHHRALHAAGDERRWWEAHKQAPMEVANQLWQASQNIPSD